MARLCCVVLLGMVLGAEALNLAPFFTADMNQHTLTENTPVGQVVYRLDGIDPEGSRVFFGLEGTDKLKVDRLTGEVTVAELIDRETEGSSGEIRLTVTIEDEVEVDEDQEEGAASSPSSPPNVVRVPISIIILDENDNEPLFRGAPYETSLSEDTPVGTTIFRALEATDADLVGEVLEVRCLNAGREGYETGLCEYFDIVPRVRETDHDMFRGSVVLKKPLDYRQRQIYQLPIAVHDGVHTVYSEMTFTVTDVQNTPPVFMGSLTGIVNEDDPIGTVVMTVKARDGDTGHARRVIYSLEEEGSNNYFAIDINSGQITVDRKLDRESLVASSGVLKLKVRASELVNGIPGEDATTSSVADITITIRDVNDEAPKFNKQEYEVTIPENVPFGTPLANLDMELKDTDTGPNAQFKIDLLDGGAGKFAVEPRRANSHTAVSLKVNSKDLDYENPNERKFLLLVRAVETNTKNQLSSTATVTVQVQDLNDNSPTFSKDSYTALVSESATEGTDVTAITATDRDGGDFGTQGIRYALRGTGAELFNVDPISGRITVAACHPETGAECLDFERTKAYFLSYSATDDNGEGRRSVVNLRVTVGDANDNPPIFSKKNHVATIDEGESHFQPRLVLKAKDRDESSRLKFRIADTNVPRLFTVDSATGEITVATAGGLRLDNIPTDKIHLVVEVSDGSSMDTAEVDIAVKDVNDRVPTFEKPVYLSSVPENAPVGTPVENVVATDADFAVNALLHYRIQKGSYDDFHLDAHTGLVTVSSPLDYDRRDSYDIEVVAVDGGTPALSGTATLTVSIMNKNNKVPAFLPATQRAQVTEDSSPGHAVLRMNASDADVVDASTDLVYTLVEPATAVDADGKPVSTEDFKSFFALDSQTGELTVAGRLDRSAAAVVTLTVAATDTSADPPQHGYGTAVVTIVDINDFPPEFQDPWTPESPYITIEVPEEQANDTVVYKFMATDSDSNIDYFQIKPKNKYFDIDKSTGNLLMKSRLDYESLDDPRRVTFDLIVFDTGIPQKSSSALVVANVKNLNDEEPEFEQDRYEAQVVENAEPGTPVLGVSAVDADEGEFGQVRYSLTGSHAAAFYIDEYDGTVVVADPSALDREQVQHLVIQAVATDSGGRSAIVPVNVTVLDENDNQPGFVQRSYDVTIVDNIPYFPEPSPIAQVVAEDPDEGDNAKLYYWIVAGNEEGRFFVDHDSGVVFPNASFLGLTGQRFDLTIEVTDEGGAAVWPSPDRASLSIVVESVNTHKPEWFPPPPPDQTIRIQEESFSDDVVILKVNARDRDAAENGRISYFLKVDNRNVGETADGHFRVNEVTGELKASGTFDREDRERYELVLVARDHGQPVSFETLRLVTVVITDVNDNDPIFPDSLVSDDSSGAVRFTVPEEEDPGYLVGRVRAEDLDEGDHGKVYYYIAEGNTERWFSIDKTYGNIYTKRAIDREKIARFDLVIKASNNADMVCEGETCDVRVTETDFYNRAAIRVEIFVEDINDNLPQFESEEFFVGIPYDAKVGDLILNAAAYDLDVGNEVDDPGSDGHRHRLTYALRSSNLFRSGEVASSGSLVPSPFAMDPHTGRITLVALVAEFNQDKFVLDVEAKESESGHRAKARVHLWIYEPEQLVKLVIMKPPAEVKGKLEGEILRELRNATRDHVALDDIRFHVDNESLRSGGEALHRDMTDMFVHAVDRDSNLILEPQELLKKVDSSYDHLSLYYEQVGIHSIVPASDGIVGASVAGSGIDANLAALIVLLVVIFFGVVLFSVLCCCMKGWVAKAPSSSTSSKKLLSSHHQPHSQDAPPIYNPASVMDEAVQMGSPISPTPAGGTDNPLWIDQKFKAYEEQELTMTVFSDQENSVISGAGNSSSGNGGSHLHPHQHPAGAAGSMGRHAGQQLDTQSNAYATINKLPLAPGAGGAGRRSLFGAMQHDAGLPDYATLEKYVSSSAARSPPGPVVPGIHSVPTTHLDASSLPRPSAGRRPSNDFRGSNLVINRNGEPELVADLM